MNHWAILCGKRGCIALLCGLALALGGCGGRTADDLDATADGEDTIVDAVTDSVSADVGAEIGAPPTDTAAVGDTTLDAVDLTSAEDLADLALDGASDLADQTETVTLSATTIFALQDPQSALPGDQPCSMDAGQNPVLVRPAPVKLTQVVVTGMPHSASPTLYRFYVAEKAGGTFSGIAVVIDKTQFAALGVTLSLGDELTIVGQLQEWYCFTRISVDLAQSGHQLLRTATGQPLPAPVEVTRCAELEQESLESVRVRLTNVLVTDASLANGEIAIEDLAQQTCRLDDEFRSSIEQNLTFWSNDPNHADHQHKPGVSQTAYRAVIGIVMFTFGKFNLEPRNLADLTPFARCDDGVANGAETAKDCGGRTLWINEITAVRTPFDETFDTIAQTVEVVGPAGMDLSGWRILFAQESETSMSTVTLAPGTVLSNDPAHSGFGLLRVTIPDVPLGALEDTPVLAFALLRPQVVGGVVQFLSIGGSYSPSSGPLKGSSATVLDVQLPQAAGMSLSLVGMGRRAADFSWSVRPLSATAPNDGQRFVQLCPACALADACQTHEDCPYNCVGGVCTTCGDGKKDNGEECDAQDGICDASCKRACLLGFEQLKTGTSCYMIFKKEVNNWAGARDHCIGLGGHLIAMSSKAEYDAAIAAFSHVVPHIFVGLNDIANEGTLVWDLGTLGAQPYTPYNDPDPAPTLVDSGNFSNVDGRDCLAFVFNGVFGTKPGQLAFRDCGEVLPFLCEIDY